MICATSLGQPRSRFRFLRAYSSPAQDYLRRVINADLASNTGAGIIRIGVCDAIAAFIDGAIADGLLSTSAGVISQATSKIKASCIMMGANTLSGALTPLVGPGPTSYNFVSNDYDRKTGLMGDGSTKYLNSNRNNNADPQDSQHVSVYMSTAPTSGVTLMGAGQTDVGATNLLTGASRSRNAIAVNYSASATPGFIGISRGNSASYTQRVNSVTTTATQASDPPVSTDHLLYARLNLSLGTIQLFSNPRIAFYSIGESLDLALLDARVTTLASSIAAVLP